MKIRNAIFGTSVWVFAAGASALSLGGSRGAVVLGAPVDLSFDVQPDPGTDLASSCVTAKLVAGDTAIGDAKVRVVPLPDMRGRPPAVRVQAAIAMDEPVLTVTLSAGCAGKVTRSYTFFAELPSTVARTASPVDVSRLPSFAATGVDAQRPIQEAAGQRASGAAASFPVPSAGASVPSGTRAEAAQDPQVARPAVRNVPVRAPERTSTRSQVSAAMPPAKSKAPAASPPVDRARLLVEPLDVWLDRPVALRTSPELLVMPSDQPTAQRAQAAAVWKALNAQPGDATQEADRLKALEADVAALRTQAASDRASATQLQQQLELAESERFPASLVYALGGMLFLALLAVVWAWGRMRSASDNAVRAWRDSVAALGGRDAVAEHGAALGLPPDPSDHWLPSDEAAALDRAAGSAAAPLVPPFVATAPLPSAPAPLQPIVPAPAPDAVAAPQPALHIVSPQELFDIQQQAEFFISVGEHQQAIEVLKKHIAERGATSPLAYLELLRLYHTLSRVEEFTQLRAQFMQSFNAQVPEFASFHRTGRMLYHYTDALADIEAEWTSPSVLPLLENLLFRHDGARSVEPFDLAAYDDLLLLLSIAQTTPASARGEPAPRKRTTPLAAPRDETLVQPALAQKVSAGMAVPSEDSRGAALDFDFDAMSPAPARSPQVSEAAGGIAGAASRAPGTDKRGAPLDLDLDLDLGLDLSEPPRITLSDLPAAPLTAPPSPGQAIGFGMDNDLVELRLELEQKNSSRK